jgi:hypothetical protein
MRLAASTFLAGMMLAALPAVHGAGIAQAGEPAAKEPAKTYLVTVAVSGMS